MSRHRPYHHHCDFCSRSREAAELLFRSGKGGLQPAICTDCIDLFSDIAALHRRNPAAAGRAIAAINGASPARIRELADKIDGGQG